MKKLWGAVLASALPFGMAAADENLFGYVKGAETLPTGAWEIYQWLTERSDKGAGDYQAIDSKTEIEYGVTDRLSLAGSVKMQRIDTSGLLIDGYLPKEESYGFRSSGIEASLKYNFLSPAKDDIGFATYVSFNYDWLDPHSGQDKDKYAIEVELLLQKYYLEGELIWVGNLAMESTYAKRGAIDNLPADFEWSTDPEIEWEWRVGTGLSYRFAPNWFVGAELNYETEFETEVGQERWSVFAGPTLHYGAAEWWCTLSWMPQVRGGGEQYADQSDTDLHLIEKTEQEVRFKLGFNF